MRLHLQMIVMKMTMPHTKERKLSFWDNSRVEFVIPLRAEILFAYSTKHILD